MKKKTIQLRTPLDRTPLDRTRNDPPPSGGDLLAEINRSNPQVFARICAVRLEASQRKDAGDDYRFEISVSSEVPVYRWGELEILSHDPGDVRLDWIASGNAPFLWMHDSREQIGIVESFSIESGRGTAVVRFGKSKLAQEKRQDVIDGILVNISIGYRVWGYELVEKTEGQPPVYRVTDWEPKEISAVSNPADTTIGFNRADSKNMREGLVPTPSPNNNRQENTMPKYIKDLAIRYGMDPETSTIEAVLARHEKELKERAVKEGEVSGRKAAEDAAKGELARRDAIESMGREAGMEGEARTAIEKETSVEAFRKEITDKLIAERKSSTIPLGGSGSRALSSQQAKDIRSFSLARYLLGAMGERIDGIEAEIFSEGQREADSLGLGVGPGYLPTMILNEVGVRAEMHRSNRTRAQVVGTDSAGGFAVGTQTIGLIGALNPRLWMARAGVKMLTGLRNNVTLPGVAAEGDAESLAEVESMGGANVTLDARTLSPSRKGTQVTFGLQLLRQSSPQIEGVLSDIIYSRIARKYNADAIAWLLALSGTNVVTTSGATLSRAIMRQFKTLVAADNADGIPGTFLFNTNVEGKLDNVKVDDGSGKFLYSETDAGEGRVLNRKAISTNLMADANIIYLDGTRVWMGDWGGIDFIRDNVTKAASGEIVLTANSFIDFAIEHPEHVAKATDVDPTA